MIYQIFKNTYRIPITLREKLEIPSLLTICDYVASHEADSRSCILETVDEITLKRQWDKLKSLSLFIPAPFPYVLVAQYELIETDISKYVGFVTRKKVEEISNISWTHKAVESLIFGLKLDRITREIAEKEKMEAKNNGKRRR